MTFLPRRSFRPDLILAAIWLATRLWLVPNAEFWAQWEVWQARKLLEYGFWARGGAVMAPPFMAGVMPFPADLNYTNHPFPMLWVYTALFSVGGAGLCLAFLLTFKFASMLALHTLLRRVFNPGAAFWAVVLYILAPAALTMDVESNIIGVAAAFWPFAALLAIGVSEGRVRPWWLGLMVFAGVQTDWFFASFGPALMWLSAPTSARWRDLPREIFCWPGSRAVLIAGGVASALFFAQFAHYVPDFGAALSYLHQQTGSGSAGPSRGHLLLVMLARQIFFVGPALTCAALLGLFCWPSYGAARRLLQASLIFIAGFTAVQIALAQFCFIETSPYYFVLFFAATLATPAIQQMLSSRMLAAGVAACALAVAAYAMFRDTIPQLPAVPKALAPMFAHHAGADEIVLSNLRPQNPPFAPWDSSGPALMSEVADRMILLGVNDRPTLDSVNHHVGRNFARLVFAYCPDQPLSDDLHMAIEARGSLLGKEVFMPPSQTNPPAAQLRKLVWKFTGRYAQRGGEEESAHAPVRLEFYRLPEGWASPGG